MSKLLTLLESPAPGQYDDTEHDQLHNVQSVVNEAETVIADLANAIFTAIGPLYDKARAAAPLVPDDQLREHLVEIIMRELHDRVAP